LFPRKETFCEKSERERDKTTGREEENTFIIRNTIVDHYSSHSELIISPSRKCFPSLEGAFIKK